jgi:hypothetical protein
MEETILVQRAYTAVVEYFMKTGRAPHYIELAATLGLRPEEARELQHKAADSSIACWFVKDTDYVESWAPFSNVPTHYLVTIKGDQKWYGQWGLEATAVRWLYPGTEIRIDTRCLDCGQPISVRLRGEDILEANPTTTVGHMNIPFAKSLTGEVSWGKAWSRMNLFRSEEHVKIWPHYDPVSAESIMPLSNWAQVFSGPLMRNRLQPDYLSRVNEYASEMILSLKKLGKAGPFWTPK